MTRKVIIKELIWVGVILLVSVFVAHFNALIFVKSPEELSRKQLVPFGDPREEVYWICFYLLLIKYCFQGLILLVRQNIVINIAALLLSLWALFVAGFVIVVVILSALYSNNLYDLLNQNVLRHHTIPLLKTMGIFSFVIIATRELILKVRLLSANKVSHGQKS